VIFRFFAFATLASISIPDFRDLYFKRKMLSHIHGKPNKASPRILSNELKENASSVTSIFGVGMFAITPVQYVPSSTDAMPSTQGLPSDLRHYEAHQLQWVPLSS